MDLGAYKADNDKISDVCDLNYDDDGGGGGCSKCVCGRLVSGGRGQCCPSLTELLVCICLRDTEYVNSQSRLTWEHHLPPAPCRRVLEGALIFPFQHETFAICLYHSLTDSRTPTEYIVTTPSQKLPGEVLPMAVVHPLWRIKVWYCSSLPPSRLCLD